MRTVDIAYVMRRLEVTKDVVSRWIISGVLTPLDSFKGTFDRDEVERLLPPRIQRRNITLVTAETGIAVVGCTTHTLRSWAEAGVITVVILPASKSRKPRFLRYVLEELQLIACVPCHITMCRLATLVFESDVSKERLRKWVDRGDLPAKPSRLYPGDYVIRTTDVMRLLVNEQYM